MSSLAVIPARGGSKRIPRKNTKLFFGKPMISYAIELAIETGLFTNIVVSTDDNEIAEQALNLGAEVPFMRPIHLANDHAGTLPVVNHAINHMISVGLEFENVCSIYPSVPFLKPAYIHDSYKLIQKNPNVFCFPVARFPSAPQRAFALGNSNVLQPLYSENALTRTQDLAPAFFDAGQFYFAQKSTWLNAESIHKNAIGLPVSTYEFVDIDNQSDWVFAEKLMKLQKMEDI